MATLLSRRRIWLPILHQDGSTAESGLSGDPLARYRRDFRTIADRSFISHPSSPLDEILDLGRKLVKNIRATFPDIVLRLAVPIHFYVIDLQTALRFDLRGGIVEVDQRSKKECDLAQLPQFARSD